MSQLMEVTIYAESVDDLREQLVKFAGSYGLALAPADENKSVLTDTRQATLPFPTAAGGGGEPSAPQPQEEKPEKIEKSPKGKRAKKDSTETATSTAQDAQAPSAPIAASAVSAPSAPAPSTEPSTPQPAATSADSNISPEQEARKALNDMVAAYESAGIPKAREVVGKFKRADGSPAAMFSQVQPADYAELIKVCKEETAKKPAKAS